MAGNEDADRDRYEAGRAPVHKIGDKLPQMRSGSGGSGGSGGCGAGR